MRGGTSTIKPVNPDHTIYSIAFRLEADREIQIGKLGKFHFPKGNYLYVGSAKRNIQSRVDRHLRTGKKLRWHIDYFREHAEVIEVETFDSTYSECECLRLLKNLKRGKVIVPKFGSSDCKCESHFFRFD